jgi:serine/threonine-protein kinase
MSQPPDDEEDLIFSGKALAADGAVQPAKPIPLLHEIPSQPPDSLISDPAYEPTVISSSRLEPVVPRMRTEVELAERPPPPTESDFEPSWKQKPLRFSSPDINWGRWLPRLVVLGVLLGGVWAVSTGKIHFPKLPAFGFLKSAPDEKKGEKRVGTPAPTLLVLSEPSGATVLIAGTEVGVTPWAGDNVWPREPLRIEVRKAGYKPWQGVALGGTQATLEASLRRK